jgi:hypothetical protein
VRRYQQYIHTLNNIPKVCILLNMPMSGLGQEGAGEVLPAGGVARSHRSASARRPAATQAFHRSMLWSSGPAGFPT